MIPSAIILDTETTDTKEPEVIELAWVSYDNIARFHRRFKPTKPSKFGALATHHILDWELADCEPSTDALKYAYPAEYWIGHNIDFDWEALGSPQVKRICTLAIARRLWPELDSHKLGAVAYFVLGANANTRELLRNAHSAGADVELTRQIFIAMSEVIGTTDLARLYAFSEDAGSPLV